MPVASQRSSIAPAILPQPTSQNGPGSAGTLISGFALRLDQGGGDAFGGGLVGPEHELEDGVEAFAFLDRGFDQRPGLLHRQRAALLASQKRGVADEDEAGGLPYHDMAETELHVDAADRPIGME